MLEGRYDHRSIKALYILCLLLLEEHVKAVLHLPESICTHATPMIDLKELASFVSDVPLQSNQCTSGTVNLTGEVHSDLPSLNTQCQV